MAFFKRIARAWRAFLAAFRDQPVVTAESQADDSPVLAEVRGPKNVRATRKVDGLEIVLFDGRDKGKARRACEHAASLGHRGITLTIDGVDRTNPLWR